MADEDADTHQCGCCKRIFHNLDLFIVHRKAGLCAKNMQSFYSSPNLMVSTVDIVPESVCDAKASQLPKNAKKIKTNRKEKSVQKQTSTKKPRKQNHAEVTSLQVTEQNSPKMTATTASCDYANDPWPIRENMETTISKIVINLNTDEIPTDVESLSDYAEDEDYDSMFLNDVDFETHLQETTGSSQSDGDNLKKASSNLNILQAKSVPVACPSCDATSPTQLELDRHCRKYHFLTKFACQQCSAVFLCSQHLRMHISSSHQTLPKVLLWQEKKTTYYQYPPELAVSAPCNKSKQINLMLKVPFDFRDLESKVNVPEKFLGSVLIQFYCCTCREFLLTYAQAVHHISVHITKNNIPGLCRYCGKTFKNYDQLWRHVMSYVHDYLTDVEVNAYKTQLINEHQQHLKVLPFCKPNSTNASGLPYDLIRTYMCASCDRTFDQKVAFYRHLRMEHSELDEFVQEVTCPICFTLFNTKTNMTKHIASQHRPTQQVPDGLFDQQDSLNRTTSSNRCFVCCEDASSEGAYIAHMEKHRVWAPIQGQSSIPPNLLDMVNDCSTGAQYLKICVQSLSAEPWPSPSKDFTGSNAIPTTSDIPWVNEDKLSYYPSEELFFPENTFSPNKTADHTILSEFLPQQPCTTYTTALTPPSHAPPVSNTQMNPTYSCAPFNSPPAQSSANHDLAAQSDINSILAMLTNSSQPSAATAGISNEQLSSYLELLQASQFMGKDATGDSSTDNRLSEMSQQLLCPYCLLLAKSIGQMYDHKVIAHNLQAVFQCVQNDCLQVFFNLGDYELHSQVHDQFSRICNICNYHSPSRAGIIIHKTTSHRNIHKHDLGFCCQICHITFTCQDALIKHASDSKHHYICKSCGKVFNCRKALQEHDLAHKGIRSALCEECGATFANAKTLYRHRQIHKDRSHVCLECGKKFNKGEHLRRHLVSIHSEEKPHLCDHPGCGKAFKRKDKLQEHQTKHKPQKKYRCDLCGREYRYREGLKYHMKTHEKEGKYTCTICKTNQQTVTFTRPGMYQQHMAEQHGQTFRRSHLYPCQVHNCLLVFSRPERCNRHMEKDHDVPVNWDSVCQKCGRGFPGAKSFQRHLALCKTKCGDVPVSSAGVSLALTSAGIAPTVVLQDQAVLPTTEHCGDARQVASTNSLLVNILKQAGRGDAKIKTAKAKENSGGNKQLQPILPITQTEAKMSESEGPWVYNLSDISGVMKDDSKAKATLNHVGSADQMVDEYSQCLLQAANQYLKADNGQEVQGLCNTVCGNQQANGHVTWLSSSFPLLSSSMPMYVSSNPANTVCTSVGNLLAIGNTSVQEASKPNSLVNLAGLTSEGPQQILLENGQILTAANFVQLVNGITPIGGITLSNPAPTGLSSSRRNKKKATSDNCKSPKPAILHRKQTHTSQDYRPIVWQPSAGDQGCTLTNQGSTLPELAEIPFSLLEMLNMTNHGDNHFILTNTIPQQSAVPLMAASAVQPTATLSFVLAPTQLGSINLPNVVFSPTLLPASGITNITTINTGLSSNSIGSADNGSNLPPTFIRL